MKQLTGNQVRSLFLEFFKEKGHMIEPSVSLIPINDPSLLWINSGVATLKKYFDGREKPLCNRIANAQKCIRTNDIENVGKTARHHTLFEMLGNFSIGDYFKEDALKYAWEFLTDEKWLNMDKDRFYVTVYDQDEQAYHIWTDIIKFNPNKILKTKDNFWEIGDGPSGPNSEIFYDRGIYYDPDCIGEKLFFEEIENDRYVEVWNVVFSQYDAKEGVERKNYQELPQKNIDTGLGLERLVSIIQNAETNFDSDLFYPIILKIREFTTEKYDGQRQMAYRVIADHIRTITFALSDGATFSNEGRGYVLRRILRRALRYGIILDIKMPFMYKLVDIVIKIMKDYYPNISENTKFIKQIIKKEEESFSKTLINGERLLEEAMTNNEKQILKGETIFKLYDTYGFPKELTCEIALEKGYTVDLQGFEKCMDIQKQNAKKARTKVDSLSSQSKDLLNFKEDFKFVGYDNFNIDTIVTGLFIDEYNTNTIKDKGQIVFLNSCFYAESGGQDSDYGYIFNDNFKAKITNVSKMVNGQFIHSIEVEYGEINLNDNISLVVNSNRRKKIMCNHTAVHLLQSALREVVGTHIKQAGSFVGEDYARFDFTHFEKVDSEKLSIIENKVNNYIFDCLDVKIDIMSLDEAKKTNAIALFDEKYGEFVRVVTIGDISKEFCGGTHVTNTGNIGIFKIEFEESIGSGIRRIQILTGKNAYNSFITYQNQLNDIAIKLNLNHTNLINDRLDIILNDNSNYKKQLDELLHNKLIDDAKKIVEQAKIYKELKLIILSLEFDDIKNLKSYALTLHNLAKECIVFIVNKNEVISVICVCSNIANNKGYKANDIIKNITNKFNGKGGGRNDYAQGGVDITTNIDNIINYFNKEVLENALI